MCLYIAFLTEDEIVGWHQQLNGHELEQTPGNGEGQGSLACCSPWDPKELDMIEWLNNNIASLLLLLYVENGENENKELLPQITTNGKYILAIFQLK